MHHCVYQKKKRQTSRIAQIYILICSCHVTKCGKAQKGVNTFARHCMCGEVCTPSRLSISLQEVHMSPLTDLMNVDLDNLRHSHTSCE